MTVQYKYSYEKNAQLLRDRGIGFEEIIQFIADGNLLAIGEHPNKKKYPHQQLYYVRVAEELYVVPYVIEADGAIFLKTLFPSRKPRMRYLK